MTLILHAGANPIDYAALRQLDTPAPTATHVPVPHYRLLDMVVGSLAYYGHEAVDQHHGVTPDGMRYFAVISLRSPYTGYCDMLGLRNSHDRSLPVGIAFGSRVMVCDNTAFIADHVIRTKHTAKLKSRLPGLVGELIEPLAQQRESQAKTLQLYQRTELTEPMADHIVMSLYRQDVLNVTRIADVVRQWQEPAHDWGGPTAWKLFNCVTFVLTGRVAENPGTTTRLHRVIDGVVEAVH